MVEEVRAIVKIFRRSPKKNDAILQTYVKRELGKELNLVLECRTRWNSLFNMLSRFLQLRSAVQKAMIDMKEVKMQISQLYKTSFQLSSLLSLQLRLCVGVTRISSPLKRL